MIEKCFDVPFVAKLAQREKQIQQNYRPIIGVHKWFARRPGTLFRALLLAEWSEGQPLPSLFFKGHNKQSFVVGDPFMGGGTPLLEANRMGCHVIGTDINPMAYWIVRQELAELDRQAFQAAAYDVVTKVEAQLGVLYQTNCVYCNESAQVKYFLWVKQDECSNCHRSVDLFPNYLVAKNQRHPNYVLVCPACGELNEVSKLDRKPLAAYCSNCAGQLNVEGIAQRNRYHCPHCHSLNTYPGIRNEPPTHRLFALEYQCSNCAPTHQGRFFKAPDIADLASFEKAEKHLQEIPKNYIPLDSIPPGDETHRLRRWGYHNYYELFNTRQLLGLQTLAAAISEVSDESIRHALLTVFSDTLRYQNMLCRYDSYALKIIDIFSVHGFPVSLIQCENSLLGIPDVGSGGFRHFVEKYDRAKAYCEKPFETYPGNPKKTVFIPEERIGARFVSWFPRSSDLRTARLESTSADKMTLPPESLDAVITDPPYFANVQYAELMDFCYVWLRQHLADTFPPFQLSSTRSPAELTVNQTEGRDITHFTAGLSQVFMKFTRALKPSAPFAFTYHHNDLNAYLPIAVALLDAQLVCTITLPCPAEMGASIHINGTQSSILDTIFVCRITGRIKASYFNPALEVLKKVLRMDLKMLQQAGLTPTVGDARCLLSGHLIRLSVWQLRPMWQHEVAISTKLTRVKAALQQIYPLDLLNGLATETVSLLEDVDLLASMRVNEERAGYEDELSF